MFKAILFDFGGVIYTHPKEVIPEVIARIYKIPLETAIEEYKQYKLDYYLGKLSTDKLINSLSKAFRSKKTNEEIKKLWLINYSDLAKSNKEILNIIKKLHLNYKVYLFSNTTEMSHLHNRETGIYDNFDGLFMSYQMGVKKPDPEIYKKILFSIGFKPTECIFIDDDPKNLEPAKQLGITTILFNVLIDSPLKLIKELKEIGIKID